MLAVLLLLAATGVFAWLIHPHYPIDQWLFWHYAGYWLATGAWAVAAWGTGSLLLDRVFRTRFPFLEHLVIAFTLGVLGFEWLMFLLGVVQRYHRGVFFVAPLVLIGISVGALRKLRRRALRLFRRPPPERSLLRLGIIAFGLLGLLMVYVLLLTPENVQFDSRWKHMALAEDYVAHGGIRRATEGWVFSARPHITSYLYAWAFLAPTDLLFDKMELGAHLEFFAFVVTTVIGIPALVRRLLPRADPSMVWAARFLFPGLFVYDSSVSAGADHFGALYAVPIALVLLRVWRDLDLRQIALLATLLGGVSLVKETAALMLVPFPVLVVGTRCLMAGVRRLRGHEEASDPRAPFRAPLLGILVGLLVSAPLWAKNLIFYGDPLYPNLHALFHPTPWSEAAAYKFKWAYSERQMWSPDRDWHGLQQTLRALLNFSFVPHDWPTFHRDVPVFGSLFTLLLAPLLLLKGVGRIWFLVAWVHLGIFFWFSVHHQDRYLQALVPLMAVTVAAVLVLGWRRFGRPARGPLALLVALQVVWGGDAFFLQTHAMADSPLKRVVNLMSAGFERDYEGRFSIQRRYQQIGDGLPKGSRVLFHEHHPHLGVGTESVLDSYQWQYAIDYGQAGSPEGIRRLLRGLGVTHVFYFSRKSNGAASLASDILFDQFVTELAKGRRKVSGGYVVTLPDRPMDDGPPGRVLVVSCKRAPTSGLYPVAALDVPAFGPKRGHYPPPERVSSQADEPFRLLDEAEYVVREPHCKRWPSGRKRDFVLAFKRGKRRTEFEVYRHAAGNEPEDSPDSEAAESEREQDEGPDEDR